MPLYGRPIYGSDYYGVTKIKPVRVGGGYLRPMPMQRTPIRQLDPGIWVVLYAANAIDEEELAALLAAR